MFPPARYKVWAALRPETVQTIANQSCSMMQLQLVHRVDLRPPPTIITRGDIISVDNDGNNMRLVFRNAESQSSNNQDTRDDDSKETMGNTGESEDRREKEKGGMLRLCTGSLAVMPPTAEALSPVFGRGRKVRGQPIRHDC